MSARKPTPARVPKRPLNRKRCEYTFAVTGNYTAAEAETILRVLDAVAPEGTMFIREPEEHSPLPEPWAERGEGRALDTTDDEDAALRSLPDYYA